MDDDLVNFVLICQMGLASFLFRWNISCCDKPSYSGHQVTLAETGILFVFREAFKNKNDETYGIFHYTEQGFYGIRGISRQVAWEKAEPIAAPYCTDCLEQA